MGTMARRMKDSLSKRALKPPRTKSSYSFRMNTEEFEFALGAIETWNSGGRRLIQFPKTLPRNGWVRVKTKAAWESINKVLLLRGEGTTLGAINASLGRFFLARETPGVGPRNKTYLQRLSFGDFIANDYYDMSQASLFLRSQFEFWLENEPQEGLKPSSILKPWYNALKDQYVKRFSPDLSQSDLTAIHAGAMRLMKLAPEWDDNVAILPHLEIPGIQLYAQFMCDAIEWAQKKKIFRHISPGVLKARRLADICEDYFKDIGKWIG